jgi:hypothetical protein
MRLIMLLIFGFVISLNAYSQPQLSPRPPGVFVQIHEETSEDRDCGLNFVALKAASESVLRSNGYRLRYAREYGHANSLITITTVKFGGLCNVMTQYEFSFDDGVLAPWQTMYLPVRVVVCSKANLLSGSPQTMQERVRRSLVSFAEICVSEEEQRRHRR